MKKFMLIVTGVLGFTWAYSQKLPKVQNNSVHAPSNVKIDGKLTEWSEKFGAYNTGNHIYYTLSNDDKNLYLVVRMDGLIGSRKIFRGGLTFTASPAKAGQVSITYPFIAYNRNNYLSDQADGGPMLRYAYRAAKKTNDNTDEDFANITDALRGYKEVHVKGVPGINDPVLSVYNAQDIQTGAGIDKHMRYTYELAIPLKYFQAASGDAKPLKYSIQLRASPTEEGKRPIENPVQTASTQVLKVADRLQPQSLDELYLDNDTSFSGESTLATK